MAFRWSMPSECVEFYPGAFDPANPRKGGEFKLIHTKKWDGTPEDEGVMMSLTRSRLTDGEFAFPGTFRCFLSKMIGPLKTLSSASR